MINRKLAELRHQKDRIDIAIAVLAELREELVTGVVPADLNSDNIDLFMANVKPMLSKRQWDDVYRDLRRKADEEPGWRS